MKRQARDERGLRRVEHHVHRERLARRRLRRHVEREVEHADAFDGGSCAAAASCDRFLAGLGRHGEVVVDEERRRETPSARRSCCRAPRAPRRGAPTTRASPCDRARPCRAPLDRRLGLIELAVVPGLTRVSLSAAVPRGSVPAVAAIEQINPATQKARRAHRPQAYRRCRWSRNDRWLRDGQATETLALASRARSRTGTCP